MSDPHVLIVEDEQPLADLYAAQVGDIFTTSVAYNGEQALDILDSHSDEIEVVLLDRLMPGLSGDEVLEVIQDRNLDCSVVMITAVDPDFDIIQMGFDDYLTKPVSEDELCDTVERLVTQSDYDEQVRDHLALLSKKMALKDQKDHEELEASQEYTQLEQDIIESRNQLDTALSGDIFVELLLKETGDRLFVVLQYDADSWQYRYVSTRAEEQIVTIDSDLNDLLDQFRQEGRQRARLNTTFELDGYYCSLHLFDTLVLINFYQNNEQGIICGFDPQAASHLTDFVSVVYPYIQQTNMTDIDGDSQNRRYNR